MVWVRFTFVDLMYMGFEAKLGGGEFQFNTSGDMYNARFSAGLSQEQKYAVAYRVLHLFLRHCRSAIDHRLATTSLCLYLFSEYIKIKYWKETLDCAIIAANLALSQPPDEIDLHAATALNLVGEALENLGEFLTAACVYDEAVQQCLREIRNLLVISV